MKITELKDGTGFVVSQKGCWVSGVYASEKAARMAVKLSPDDLEARWQACIKANPDMPTLTEEALT